VRNTAASVVLGKDSSRHVIQVYDLWTKPNDLGRYPVVKNIRTIAGYGRVSYFHTSLSQFLLGYVFSLFGGRLGLAAGASEAAMDPELCDTPLVAPCTCFRINL
jgi:hypothetical protein